MALVLRPHQKELVNFAVSRPNTLVWHEVGLGKTLAAVSSARILLSRIKHHPSPMVKSANPKALVICPKYLIPQWRSEINEHAPDMNHQIIYMPYSQLHKAKFMVNYYDMRVLIFDESHYLKTMGTQRLGYTIELLKLISETKAAFQMGSILKLTGTPMPNSAAEMYTTWAMMGAPTLKESMSRMLDKKRYNNWIASFTERDLKKIKITSKKTGKVYTKEVYSAPRGADSDKVFELIKGFTHFRTADMCLDLDKPNEVYTDLGIKDDTLLEAADITKPLYYMAFVERITRAKVPHALTWVRDFVESNPGQRLLVFCPYKWALTELHEAFKSSSSLITGDFSDDERGMAKKCYDDGTRPLLFGTYGAMSTGLNLQAGHHSLYLGYPWSPKIVRQAQGRTNRQGQKHVTHHFFLMSGQNDKKILKSLRLKEEGIQAIEDLLVEDIATYTNNLTIEDLV